MKPKFLMIAATGLWSLALPASAQIISTSIPRAETPAGGKGTAGEEKKFALHFMAAPISKWRYNELAGGNIQNVEAYDLGIFSGNPNSDFLLAGEAVFKLGRDVTFGIGGWYNKVGQVTYTFEVNTIATFIDGTSVIVDSPTGTLEGDLKVSEGHASIFYKSVGIQAGLVHTNSKLTSSRILTSRFLLDIGSPLNSIEGENTANDWDLYGVYKYNGQFSRPFGVSFGAGVYGKKGTTESAQRAPDDQVVFSGFVTASIDIFKGFGIDASYWYIGKTKATIGDAPEVTSDPASRFTLGLSYSFGR